MENNNLKINEILYTGKSLRGIFEDAVDLDKVRKLLEEIDYNSETPGETLQIREKVEQGYLSIEATRLDESRVLCISAGTLNVSEVGL